MSKRAHLSEPERNHLRQCIKAGMRAVDAAHTVGRSEAACRVAAKDMGLTFQPIQPTVHHNGFGQGNRRSDAYELMDYRERDERHVADVLRVTQDYGFAPYATPPVKIEARP